MVIAQLATDLHVQLATDHSLLAQAETARVAIGHILLAQPVIDLQAVVTDHSLLAQAVTVQVAIDHIPLVQPATVLQVVVIVHTPLVLVVIDPWATDLHAQPVTVLSIVTARPAAHHEVVAWVAVVHAAVVAVAVLVDLAVHQVEASVAQYPAVVVVIRAANAIQLTAKAPFAHQMQSRAMGKDVDAAAREARAQAF